MTATAGNTCPPVPPAAMISRSGESGAITPCFACSVNRPPSIVVNMDFARVRAAQVPYLISTAIVVVGLDLATKAKVRDRLDRGELHWLVEGIAGLERTENSGIAFGIGGGTTGISLIVALALAVLVWFAVRAGFGKSRTGELAIGCVIGGGLANLLDRIDDGHVTDFLVLGPWPRFNVADSALTVGILLIAIFEIQAGKGFSGDGFLP